MLNYFLQNLPFFAKFNSTIPKIGSFAIINSVISIFLPENPQEKRSNYGSFTNINSAKLKIFGVSFAKINSAFINFRINLFPQGLFFSFDKNKTAYNYSLGSGIGGKSNGSDFFRKANDSLKVFPAVGGACPPALWISFCFVFGNSLDGDDG